MRIDYHTHHERCGHAEGRLEDYVKKAIELGYDQIGLSDHMPLLHVDPETYYPGMAMPKEMLPEYVEECFELKEKYKGQIDVRVGLEGDYIEGYEEEIERIISAYPWDYVIGSVHFLGDWDISDSRQLHRWEGRDRYEVHETYYRYVKQAAQTGFYDFIGHFDVIKRFGYLPEQDPWPLQKEALDAVRAAGMAIELNASGLRMPAADMFPARRVLEYCLASGIPVTVGSDAHHPDRVGQFLDQARATLKEIGFVQLATFEKRRRVMVDF